MYDDQSAKHLPLKAATHALADRWHHSLPRQLFDHSYPHGTDPQPEAWVASCLPADGSQEGQVI